MNELVNLIVQQTGISQENAEKAAQTTVAFLKTKLPAPIAGQVDALLGGSTGGLAGMATDLLKGKLGGFGS
jgi:hypothetical protein